MKTGTIREIHRALRADGFQVSEWWIRERVRAGEIPALVSGTRSIISYEVAREYIEELLTGGKR